MAAGTDDERPSDLLLKCLDSGRVDVLCSLLSQLSKWWSFTVLEVPQLTRSLQKTNPTSTTRWMCCAAKKGRYFIVQLPWVRNVATTHGQTHRNVCKFCWFLDSADFVSALLSNGANPCVQNEDGKTAYQMCKSDVVRNAFVQEALRAITLSKYAILPSLCSCSTWTNFHC